MLRSLLLLLSALLFAPMSQAVDEKDLLPIDQAFAVSAKALSRNKIEFTWKIAPGYYLYRHRMGVSAVESNFKTNPLELPEGHHKKDQFFGEVQTYRNEVIGIQTGAAADGITSVAFVVKYQGCADLGVCYPPHKKTITVELPSAPKADSATLNLNANKPADLFGGTKITTDSLPLPAEQAFQFEGIVNNSNELLLRFTPAPGYYFYRDKVQLNITSHTSLVGIKKIQWPEAKSHHDEHFGDVKVYFTQVEVPVTLMRSSADETLVTLDVRFFGCQENGICYPPILRRIPLTLPAGGGVSDIAIAIEAATARTHAITQSSFNMIDWLQALLLALGGGLILNLMP